MSTKHQIQDAFLLVAVADPTLHTEATNVAAATSRPVIDVSTPADVARLIPRAAAVFIDAQMVAAAGLLPRHDAVFFLAHDTIAIDFEAALSCHAAHALLLPAQATELLEKLSSVSKDAVRQKHAKVTSIGVTGAAGGVGVSTFAALLAQQAVKHTDVTLVDAHPASGGIDLLVGAESTSGARWPDFIAGASGGGSITAADLRAALPHTKHGIAVISAARSDVTDNFHLEADHVNLVAQALSTAESSHLAVFDHPPGTIDSPADLLLIIAPLEVRPAAAAAKMIAQARARQREVALVSRHRGWAGLNSEELASLTDSTIIGEIPTVRSLPKTAEVSGLPTRLPHQLSSLVKSVFSEVGLK